MAPIRVVLVCLLASLACAAPASALSGAQGVAKINAQRAAHGLPPVTENPDWSGKCGLHVAWELQNGVQSHEETPGTPGYTEDGNWAGTSAVLGPTWTRGEYMGDAPWHYLQVMHPRLAQTGYAENERFSCMTTWPGFVRPPASAPTLYSVPAEGREVGWWESTAGERPTNPMDHLGLPHDTIAGPTLYLYVDGPWPTHFDAKARVLSASVTGPDGPVELLTVDHAQGAPIPGDAVLLIPRYPLRPGSTYTASATLGVEAQDQLNELDFSATHTKTWTFRTSRANAKLDTLFRPGGQLCEPRPGADVACRKATTQDLRRLGLLAEMRLAKKSKRTRTRRVVTLTASGPLVGQRGQVTAKLISALGTKTLRSRSVTLKPSQKLTYPAPPRGGILVVTVTTGPARAMQTFR